MAQSGYAQQDVERELQAAQREIEAYREAVRELAAARGEGAPSRKWVGLMVDAHHNLAAVLLEQRQHEPGAAALKVAIDWQQAVVQGDRKNAAQLQRLATLHQTNVEARVLLKDHAGAGKAATELGKTMPDALPNPIAPGPM